VDAVTAIASAFTPKARVIKYSIWCGNDSSKVIESQSKLYKHHHLQNTQSLIARVSDIRTTVCFVLPCQMPLQETPWVYCMPEKVHHFAHDALNLLKITSKG